MAIIYGVAVAVGLVDRKGASVTFSQLQFPMPRYSPEDLRGEREMVVGRETRGTEGMLGDHDVPDPRASLPVESSRRWRARAFRSIRSAR